MTNGIVLFKSIIIVAAIAGCSTESFKQGGGGKDGGQKSDAPAIPQAIPQPTAVPIPQNQVATPQVNTSLPTAQLPIKPDAVVDGMEVFKDVDRCVARAKELSPRAAFQADLSKTVNMGYYKIEPSQGLCDVHFLADLSVRIEEHEGRDSVLSRQIALYCPCNGPWARTESDPGVGPIF